MAAVRLAVFVWDKVNNQHSWESMFEDDTPSHAHACTTNHTHRTSPCCRHWSPEQKPDRCCVWSRGGSAEEEEEATAEAFPSVGIRNKEDLGGGAERKSPGGEGGVQFGAEHGTKVAPGRISRREDRDVSGVRC